jgi:hypothetical protein
VNYVREGRDLIILFILFYFFSRPLLPIPVFPFQCRGNNFILLINNVNLDVSEIIVIGNVVSHFTSVPVKDVLEVNKKKLQVDGTFIERQW